MATNNTHCECGAADATHGGRTGRDVHGLADVHDVRDVRTGARVALAVRCADGTPIGIVEWARGVEYGAMLAAAHSIAHAHNNPHIAQPAPVLAAQPPGRGEALTDALYGPQAVLAALRPLYSP